MSAIFLKWEIYGGHRRIGMLVRLAQLLRLKVSFYEAGSYR